MMSRVGAVMVALTRGEAGQPGWLDSNPTLSGDQLELADVSLTGNYALQPVWADGHSSGFYAGTWVSNIDWGGSKPSYELDLYAGFGGEVEFSAHNAEGQQAVITVAVVGVDCLKQFAQLLLACIVQRGSGSQRDGD